MFELFASSGDIGVEYVFATALDFVANSSTSNSPANACAAIKHNCRLLTLFRCLDCRVEQNEAIRRAAGRLTRVIDQQLRELSPSGGRTILQGSCIHFLKKFSGCRPARGIPEKRGGPRDWAGLNDSGVAVG